MCVLYKLINTSPNKLGQTQKQKPAGKQPQHYTEKNGKESEKNEEKEENTKLWDLFVRIVFCGFLLLIYFWANVLSLRRKLFLRLCSFFFIANYGFFFFLAGKVWTFEIIF